MGDDYPLDRVYVLQSFRGMRNGCSVSGGWLLKALEHEYIDRRVFVGVLCYVVFSRAASPDSYHVQFPLLH